MKYIRNKGEQCKILKACHLDPTSGHMGVKRTLSRITDRFMWPGVVKDVEQLVSSVTVATIKYMGRQSTACMCMYKLYVTEI